MARTAEDIREYNRGWRERNREHVREQAYEANRRRMATLQEIIREARSQPCTDCGVVLPPEAMDLDHVRGEKKRTIGNGTGFSVPSLMAELEKCDVRCPTCHRLRHVAERADDFEPPSREKVDAWNGKFAWRDEE